MIDNAAFWRLSVFIGVFVLMALLEYCLPARHSIVSQSRRWSANIVILIIGSICARLFLPITLVGIAMLTEQQGWGMLHHLGVPNVVAFILSIILLDIVIYWQHRLFHTIPVLWRIHKVHHADSHVDTTTGLRFHPIEIVLSLGVKAVAIVLLGAPVAAVLLFEIILNACSLFNHANIRLPLKWDDRLARIVITQRLHRIHHSQRVKETDSNFGFSLSWWDRIFNSFCPRARQSDELLDIGLKEFPASKSNSGIWRMLKIPFQRTNNE